MSAWWQYWACENATQPVNTGSQRFQLFGGGKNRTYFKRCKVIFMERFKRDPWTKCIIRCWTFSQVFITVYLFSQSVIFYTCSSCTEGWLFILFIYVFIFTQYTGLVAPDTNLLFPVPVVPWAGLAWRGVVVQVCNMDGGASHSAERWMMALFMLLFAAE